MRTMADVFERHEKKYLLDARQRAFIEAELIKRMTPDAHGESTIRNLYYDTPDYRLIRKSLDKPVYKEKLRVRSYRKVTGEDKVFVELKKKYKGIVYKRRIALPEQTAMKFLAGEPLELKKAGTQILKEIDYFCRVYGRPEPKVFISYDRIAYFGIHDSSLRISFDRNICWRTTELSLGSEPGGRPIMEEGQSLMEIKAGGSMPIWLVELLNRGKILPVSFSKYGKAYQTMLAEGSVTFIPEAAGTAAEPEAATVPGASGAADLRVGTAQKGVAYA